MRKERKRKDNSPSYVVSVLVRDPDPMQLTKKNTSFTLMYIFS